MATSGARPDWNAIKFQYIHNNIAVAELAREHGVKENTLWQRITRGGWAELKVGAEQKAFADAAANFSKERVKELTTFNKDDLRIARALRIRVGNRLGQKEANGEASALSAGELRMLAATAEAAQRMGRLALGASTDNVGHGGTGGEGPVEVVNVSKEEYIKARAEILQEF